MKYNIQLKLITVAMLILSVPCLVIGFVGYETSKSNMDELGRQMLKNSAKQVIQMIDVLNDEVEKGDLTLEDAQEKVKTQILSEKNSDGTRKINKDIEIGEFGYIFILDHNGNAIAHPNSEGKNLLNSKSKNGVYFAKQMIELADKGGGFTYYDYPLPNEPERIEAKIAYSELDPNWNWVIAPSSYMIDFNSGAKKVLYVLLITLGVALIAGTIIIVLFSRHLSRPLRSITKQVNRLATGDLTAEPLQVKQKDEIGQLVHDINQMTINLQEMIGEVARTTEQVAATSEELSASSEQTSKATEEITLSIHKISTGSEEQMSKAYHAAQEMENISDTIQQISAKFQEVATSSNEATRQATRGNEVILESIKQMDQIKQSSHEMKKIILSLGQKSEQIGAVISIMTSIAEQTNLLALNAAIEAARAGEYGKGFAVVADEVRKLAEQSAEAGEQVNQLIYGIQQEMDETIKASITNSSVIEAGINLAGSAGQSFQEIQQGVKTVTSQIDEMATIVNEMTVSTDKVVKSAEDAQEIATESSSFIQNVASAAEEQNASMEEISASADVLAQMAEGLQSIVSKFKL